MFTRRNRNVVDVRPPVDDPVDDDEDIPQDRFLRRWLFGKSKSTQEAYTADVGQFLAVVGTPLFEVDLDDMIRFTEHLEAQGCVQTTIYRKQRAIKSLYDFAYVAGHIDRHPFPRLKSKPGRDTLSERILSEDEVRLLLSAYGCVTGEFNADVAPYGTLLGEAEILKRMCQLSSDVGVHQIATILNGRGECGRHGAAWSGTSVWAAMCYKQNRTDFAWRNSLVLHVLYYTGGRCSEIVGLRWRDVQATPEGGQVSLFGKGGKTRHVPISKELFNLLQRYRKHGPDVSDDDAVFMSRFGCAMSKVTMWRIVSEGARIVGIRKRVGPHWLRHAHASHSLDHGVPLHVLKNSLGHASLMATERYLHVRPQAGSSDYLPSMEPEDPPKTPDTAKLVG